MAGITIRVTPEVLKTKANHISSQITMIERELSSIGNYINSSKNYWEGDASNTHQKHYQELQDDISSTIKDLKAHPRNLLAMAGLYEKTENEQKAAANELVTDVI